MILDEILEHKRREVEAAKARLPFNELEKRVRGHVAQRSFRDAVQEANQRPALIAELKRKSPSRGMLRERFDPVSLAQQLQDAGASALSVLTDEPFFGGNLEILRDVQSFVEIPILRKDFILDPYQIYEAASHQADAVLLIVQTLTEEQLLRYVQITEHLGMEALVEVHTEEDLQRALKARATLIGINTRDLRTFAMHPETITRLLPNIPAGKLAVAESGIQSRGEIQHLKDLGAHAVLIGEALMTAPDPAAKVRELFDGIW